LTVFGKIIGGGMPVGAYGGRKEIMEMISPSGPVYQAGTLSGNPVAMAVGIATLKILKNNPGIYDDIAAKAELLEKAYLETGRKYGIQLTVNRVGSLLSVFFTAEQVRDYKSAVKADLRQFTAYFAGMLERGIYVAPSQFEAMFVSNAHSTEDIEITIECINSVFSRL
jgi:glutamate-1-semialdehyde 2,1-aminomutase